MPLLAAAPASVPCGDYEVLLVLRTAEEWRRTRRNTASLVFGAEHTGRHAPRASGGADRSSARVPDGPAGRRTHPAAPFRPSDLHREEFHGRAGSSRRRDRHRLPTTGRHQ
ncbi:hypothetical protein GCM10010421_17180 [Streptomyces glaucus]|uniref:Secreted protein n=1 Tax=Streptomyces glaucus TaxID=284029 RepID=A0ABP5WL14_9ACTN